MHVQGRISSFATTCEAKLMERFPDLPHYEHFLIFESSEPEVPQARLAAAFESMADFYKLAGQEREDTVAGLRQLWAARTSVLARNGQMSAERCWCEVLKTMSAVSACSQRLLLSWLLYRSQSADCERGFSLVEECKKKIGSQHGSLTYEPYILCRLSGPLPGEADDWLGAVSESMLANQEWRLAMTASGFYQKGCRNVQRKRALRCDKGQKRPQYRMQKRTKRLQNASHLRGLQVGSAAFGLSSDIGSGETGNLPVPEIMYVHSPFRQKKQG